MTAPPRLSLFASDTLGKAVDENASLSPPRYEARPAEAARPEGAGYPDRASIRGGAPGLIGPLRQDPAPHRPLDPVDASDGRFVHDRAAPASGIKTGAAVSRGAAPVTVPRSSPEVSRAQHGPVPSPLSAGDPRGFTSGPDPTGSGIFAGLPVPGGSGPDSGPAPSLTDSTEPTAASPPSRAEVRVTDGTTPAAVSGLPAPEQPLRVSPVPEPSSAPRLSIGRIDVIFEAPKPPPQPIPPRSRPHPPRSRGFEGFAARRLGLRR